MAKKEAKSEALRKKMEETSNECSKCGSKKHKTKEHGVAKESPEELKTYDLKKGEEDENSGE